MDHSAPSTATAKTVFPSIQRVQALSEDSIECLSGAFPLKLEVIDVNYAMLCVQRCSCTGGKDNRLCDLWGQNGCLRLQRLQRSEIKPAKTKIKPFSTRFLLFAPSIGFYKPRTTAWCESLYTHGYFRQTPMDIFLARRTLPSKMRTSASSTSCQKGFLARLDCGALPSNTNERRS